jgi:hypothetical protein
MDNHYEMRINANGRSYIAKLSEQSGLCREIVFADGTQIHYAEFPSASLGAARRSDYLEAMANSIAAKDKREAA